VLVIEWPERAPEELPEEHLLVHLEYGTARTRQIAVSARGARYAELVARLARGRAVNGA
jgi:tRNA A37 threonylcarbamoyladenosine biosynthesis protein TsaE